MAQRITLELLQTMIDRINHASCSTVAPVINLKSQVGNFHLGHINGGYVLYRVSNKFGACRDYFGSGPLQKASLHALLCAFLQGLQFNTSLESSLV